MELDDQPLVSLMLVFIPRNNSDCRIALFTDFSDTWRIEECRGYSVCSVAFRVLETFSAQWVDIYISIKSPCFALVNLSGKTQTHTNSKVCLFPYLIKDSLPKMDPAVALEKSRFNGSHIITKVYKVIDGHEIEVDILYANNLDIASTQQRPAPIILRFHGGGLMCGSSLYPLFFAPWLLQLAERHSAVIVSPNYRLLPEASVQDILDDLQDSLTWTLETLPRVAREEVGIRVDTGRIMVTGDSAGGYLSLLTGLIHHDKIRAVHASYPMIEIEGSHFSGRTEKEVFGLPMMPKDFVTDYLSNMSSTTKQDVVSSDPNAERAQLLFGFIQYGRFDELFSLDKREYFPLFHLKDGGRFPRGGVVIWHGRDDTVVPVEGSEKLKAVVDEVDPGLDCQLVVRDGEHGFDHTADIDHEWVQSSLHKIITAWLD